MTATPKTMALAMGLGFIGAIGALVAMAYAWKGTVDSASLVGLDMLVALIFFAVAGCFSSQTPVKSDTVVVISALAIAFVIVATMYGAMPIWAGFVFFAIGAICIVCGCLPSTKNYIDTKKSV